MQSTAVFASYPIQAPEGLAVFEFLVFNAINASVPLSARNSSVWPDGSPFDPQVPDPGIYNLADDRNEGPVTICSNIPPGPARQGGAKYRRRNKK